MKQTKTATTNTEQQSFIKIQALNQILPFLLYSWQLSCYEQGDMEGKTKGNEIKLHHKKIQIFKEQ